jgi:hypothetical protein
MLERSSGLVFTFHLNIISVRSFQWALKFARAIKVNESEHGSTIHRPQRRPRFWGTPAMSGRDATWIPVRVATRWAVRLSALSRAFINAGEQPAHSCSCVSLGTRDDRL